MVKICMTVRNRLAITKKAIEAIQKHSVLPFQLYVYDNCTNYNLEGHFNYFREMMEKKIVTQVIFGSGESTFNAFGKASSSNMFGLQHEQDPDKDKVQFLLLIDNDVIVTPEYDKILAKAWGNVEKLKKNNIKVIGQLPGGIKEKKLLPITIAGFPACEGKLGGSGLWSVQNNFFSEIGFLNLRDFRGEVKKHDQKYWHMMEKKTNGIPYILGLQTKLSIHTGSIVGSICNVLSRNKSDPKVLEKIKFVESEKRIDEMSFDDFYNEIINNKRLINDW